MSEPSPPPERQDLEPRRGARGAEARVSFLLLAVALVGTFAAVTLFGGARGLGQHATTMPSRASALRGRSTPLRTADRHFVFGTPLRGPFAAGTERAYFGMGCFWGAERRFWTLEGVVSTASGYMGGYTPNATYEEVCSGNTGHAEVVQVVFDPRRLRYTELLRRFWEGHDPTQGMRQGNDVGTQYRSTIYTTTEGQLQAAQRSLTVYQQALSRAGFGAITTEVRTVREAGEFFYAEDYHQQYLAKNPDGYCGHGGTGVSCPIGLVPYEE
jgi:peptide-methionine (S)-S-oxide reductase